MVQIGKSQQRKGFMFGEGHEVGLDLVLPMISIGVQWDPISPLFWT